MPPKLKEPEYDLTDVTTLLRMANGNNVLELIELAHYKRDSPISGDAIRVYTHAEDVVEAVAETPKVRNNDVMDNTTSIKASANALYSTVRHEVVPLTLTVHFDDTDFDQVYTFNESLGAYFDEEGNNLSVGFDAQGNVISYDVPESM